MVGVEAENTDSRSVEELELGLGAWLCEGEARIEDDSLLWT